MPALNAVATQGMGALPVHPSAKGLPGLSAEAGDAPCAGYHQAEQEQSSRHWARCKAKGSCSGVMPTSGSLLAHPQAASGEGQGEAGCW